ncbi:MAG: thioredoxin family protein [Limnohabitans sp.]|uniref:thioredoxin family protein n=1 Tax=Limnohabitans sp. TaxID=1907725 RepID=UPI0025D3A6E8|nr:thioredoxin family protein [Limnohabitans sp.]MCO4089293.1 thioredoxin family protein [Limnohabitans sp.]
MVTNKPYLSDIELPRRADLDALRGLTLLEFGTDWCGHCRAAKPFLEEALAQHPQWQYLKIEDGPGKALGRSYRVKLWPTLVLLQDGQEVGRLVRPTNVQELLVALSV